MAKTKTSDQLRDLTRAKEILKTFEDVAKQATPCDEKKCPLAIILGKEANDPEKTARALSKYVGYKIEPIFTEGFMHGFDGSSWESSYKEAEIEFGNYENFRILPPKLDNEFFLGFFFGRYLRSIALAPARLPILKI
jgi:hypothetical protein